MFTLARKIPFRILAALFFLLPALHAQCHPLDLGLVRIERTGSGLGFTLDINPTAAQLLIHSTGKRNSTAAEVRSESLSLFRETLGAAIPRLGNVLCPWGQPAAELTPTTVRIQAQATCPDIRGEVSYSLDFVKNPNLPRGFQALVRYGREGTEHVQTVDSKNPLITLSEEPEPGMWDFITMGIRHIGAAPSEWRGESGVQLPDGIDHILFLLALILSGGTLRGLLATVTGFTLGHSLTLAIATFGILHFPSRVIESAIALSIAFVAAETILGQTPKHRWRIAAAFGLVHGFGFANALSELHLGGWQMLKALIGFNLGVELGQVMLVALLAPLVYLLRVKPKVSGVAVPSCAVLIFVAGTYWFVQRAFGF